MLATFCLQSKTSHLASVRIRWRYIRSLIARVFNFFFILLNTMYFINYAIYGMIPQTQWYSSMAYKYIGGSYLATLRCLFEVFSVYNREMNVMILKSISALRLRVQVRKARQSAEHRPDIGRYRLDPGRSPEGHRIISLKSTRHRQAIGS